MVVKADGPQEAADFAAGAMHLPRDIAWGATVTPLWAFGWPWQGFVQHVVDACNRRTPTVAEVEAKRYLAEGKG